MLNAIFKIRFDYSIWIKIEIVRILHVNSVHPMAYH
jgi:hypothetical protein